MSRSVILPVLILSLFAGSARAALTAQEATADAEKFVAEQGFADMQRKAVAAKLDSGVWYVGFRAAVGPVIYGVTVAKDGKDVKRVSQNLQLSWLTAPEEAPAPRVIPPLGKATAKVLAEKFAYDTKAIAKKPAKVTEHKADRADPSNSWWIWFPKKASGAAPAYDVVSVDKATRQVKWVENPVKAAKP